MNLIKNIVVALCLLFFAACANHPTHENFNMKMDSLIGQPAARMVPTWGQPNSTVKHHDGSQTHTWYRQKTQTWNSFASYPGTGSTMFNYWPSAQARIASWSNRYFTTLGNAGTFHVNRPMRLIHHCTLVIHTDSQDNITQYDTAGDNCVSY